MAQFRIWVKCMETKQQIRKRHLQNRNLLSQEERQKRSRCISQHLIEYFTQTQIWENCAIYGYYPHKSEVSLMELFEWLLAKKAFLAFPRVSGNMMEFYRVLSMADFCLGAFGIMEPNAGCVKADKAQAVCLVPGSVFDRSGNRYGYGKGYYDRYFCGKKELYRIGTAFESQVEAMVPSEDCDVKMHALVTERAITFFENGEERHGFIRNL